MPARHAPAQHRAERGSLSVFVALVTAAALPLMAVLIINTGGYLRATAAADTAAREAARAGGQAIDPGRAVRGRGLVADPVDARATAQNYLRRHGLSGSVHVTSDGERLEVRVRDTYRPQWLPGGAMAVSGEGSATLLHSP